MVSVLLWSILAMMRMGHEYRVVCATHFEWWGVCIASLADLFTFQPMAWMYINAAMQQYAVRRPGGNDISPIVWSILAMMNGP
jgi:hypothetical protein